MIEEAWRLVEPLLAQDEWVRFSFLAERGPAIAQLVNWFHFAADNSLESLSLYFTDERLIIVRFDKGIGYPTEVFEKYALTSVAVRRYQRRFGPLPPVADITLAGKLQHYRFNATDRALLDRCFARWTISGRSCAPEP